MASPVKPRLSGWRYKWYTDNYSLLGTDINWFGAGNCGSFYPAGENMYFWKMLKLGNEEHLTQAQINKVYHLLEKSYNPVAFKNAFGSPVEHLKGDVNYNLTERYHTDMIFYYNRASFPAAPECQTFMDEWSLNNFPDIRGSKEIWEWDVVPSRSYQDMALYWFKKSFKIAGNKGVYIDNWAFDPSYNTMMTSAYKQTNGKIMPSTGVWKMREYTKRIFIMMNQLHMKPIIFLHETSTEILPIDDFATVRYDWEWHYSQGDVQDRFPRSYILMVSTGNLPGNWPVLLSDHGALEGNPWTQITYLGVMIVHDLLGSIDTWVPQLGKLWKTYKEPFLKMAQEKGLIVYNYWGDRKQPFYSKNYDFPTIIYSIPKQKALVGITSYANKNENVDFIIKPEILGFTNYKVIDINTGKQIDVKNNKINIFFKKHDMVVLKITKE